jgi:hypothetical protein
MRQLRLSAATAERRRGRRRPPISLALVVFFRIPAWLESVRISGAHKSVVRASDYVDPRPPPTQKESRYALHGMIIKR